MKSCPCFTRVRSPKFLTVTIFSLCLFSTVAAVLSIPVLAPSYGSLLTAGTSAIPTSGDANLDRMILDASTREALDPRLVHAVIWQESKYDTKAHSPMGASGLMQLMPATARRFGCDRPDDPEENIGAGTRYLHWLLERFSGNVELALAGYNAGEGSVDKYHGVPPFNETQNYVRIIVGRYGRTYHPLLSSADAILAFNSGQISAQAGIVATQ
jgi:soluble lytic murein transglycosylase-like protein